MSESTKTEETCMHCGGEVGVVIERQSGRWGPNGPLVSFEGRRSRCQSCGEEWYDPEQSQRHTTALLKATVAALTAENERLRGLLDAPGSIAPPAQHACPRESAIGRLHSRMTCAADLAKLRIGVIAARASLHPDWAAIALAEQEIRTLEREIL
jgi:hypothetical protein